MDDYVDLNRDQKRLLKVKLEPLLHWHRYEELDTYIDLIDHMEKDVAGPLTTETVQGWFDKIISAAGRIELSLIQMAIDMGESLSDAQISEFVTRLWQRQNELEKEYLERSDEEYYRDNFRSLKKNLRRFIRKLEPEQENRLKEASASLQRFDSAWIEDRKRWLGKLESLLQREPGWQDAVLHAHESRNASRTPKYDAAIMHNISVISEAVADVINSLNDRQRVGMLKRLDKLRTDLRRLIDQPATATGI